MICSRCVMNSSDPTIQFDEQGVCNHCRKYDERVRKEVVVGEEGLRAAREIASKIKSSAVGKPYDCLIGVSGGVDSTFTAYWTKKLELTPLAVHLDNGWDSELAVANIHNTLEVLGIDLETYVIDWQEFRALQLAFLKASTPDSEIPTDHAIVSLLHQTAEKLGLKYVVIGRNVRTETHVPAAWSNGHYDWKYIQAVHEQFGTLPLVTFPHRTRMEDLHYRRPQNWFNVLDYVDYVKGDAMKVLEKELGWRAYGTKHGESVYTRFFQGYILPRKFGFDKRRGHLSSLICSGEITREEALRILSEPPYPLAMQESDKTYVIKKLEITPEEFDGIMVLPKKTIYDYPSYARDDRKLVNRLARKAYRTVRTVRRKFS